MMHNKRIISVILAVVMIISSLSLYVFAADSEDVKAYSGDTQTPIQVAEGSGTLGMHVKVNSAITAVSFCMPTWSQNGIGSMYLSAYKWENNYIDTISQDPLYTKKYEAIMDNATNKLTFDSALPAGEYLFLIEKVTSTVGCWAASNNHVSKGECLDNGYPTDYELQMTLSFKIKAPANPFAKITSEADLYGVAPKFEPVTDSLTDLSGYNLPDSSRYLTAAIQPSTWSFNSEYFGYSSKKSQKTVAITYKPNVGDITLRRQMELSASAGVDAIIIEYDTDFETIEALFSSLTEIQKDGIKVPSVILSIPDTAAAKDVCNLYLKLYRQGKYNSLWYYFDGKPLIIGDFSGFNLSIALSREILSFFSIRQYDSDWYLSEKYPQTIGYSSLSDKSSGKAEQISVNASYGKDSDFDKQLSYALENSPEIVIFTSWNGGGNAIEPTQDDSYYCKLAEFSRAYKGTQKASAASSENTIDIYRGTSQWSQIEPYFASYIGGEQLRNDIIGTQITHDSNNVYILVECAKEISSYTDKLWMNVYIDVDGYGNGWNGFDYVINKTSPKDKNTAYIEKFIDGTYETKGKTPIEYSVDGRYLQICIKRTLLGIDGKDFTLNVSATDNVSDGGNYQSFSGNILDFYTSGDAAPGGRFGFSYTSADESAEKTSETDLTEESSDKSAQNTEENSADDIGSQDFSRETSEEPESQTDNVASGGCNSAIGMPFLLIIPMGFVFKRKKDMI